MISEERRNRQACSLRVLLRRPGAESRFRRLFAAKASGNRDMTRTFYLIFWVLMISLGCYLRDNSRFELEFQEGDTMNERSTDFERLNSSDTRPFLSRAFFRSRGVTADFCSRDLFA